MLTCRHRIREWIITVRIRQVACPLVVRPWCVCQIRIVVHSVHSRPFPLPSAGPGTGGGHGIRRHTTGVVHHKHDICRSCLDLGFERYIRDIYAFFFRSAGTVTVIAVIVHSIVADFLCTRVYGCIGIITVAHVN